MKNNKINNLAHLPITILLFAYELMNMINIIIVKCIITFEKNRILTSAKQK